MLADVKWHIFWLGVLRAYIIWPQLFKRWISAIHRINLCSVDSAIGFPNTYPQGKDLSDGKRYPAFEKLGPVV